MASEMPSKVLQGCCLSMCPPSEMTLRHREGLVHPMECRPPLPDLEFQQPSNEGSCKAPIGKKGKKKSQVKGDPQYFVKEFARSSAGREIRACDVRSVPVLVRTVRYLLTEAYNRKDCSACTVHDFISNRLRAVRQDIAVQGLMCSLKAAPLLAASVRYATVQLYRMCEIPATEYNPFLDMKQLQETLACLVRLYQDHSNEPPAEPPAFCYDQDDDEEEYFFEFDITTGKVRESNGEIRGRTGDSGGESESAFNRTESHQSNDTNVGRRTEDNTAISEDDRRSSDSTAESTNDSGFVGAECVANESMTREAACFSSSARYTEDDEVSRVMKRISNMSLEAMGGEMAVDSIRRSELHSKDDKNRLNKIAGEQVKEQRESQDVSQSNSNLGRAATHSDSLKEIHAQSVAATASNGNISPVSSSEENSSVSVSNSDKRNSPVTPQSVTEREEMECIYLLLNYDKTEAVEHALDLPTFVKEGTALSRVLPAVLSYHSSGNTTAILRLLQALPPALTCALHLSLPKIQRKVLQVLSTGHSSVSSKYPLSELATQLVFPDVEAARRACQHFGLKITGEQQQFVSFQKNDFKGDIPAMTLERASWLDTKLAEGGTAMLLPHPLL